MRLDEFGTRIAHIDLSRRSVELRAAPDDWVRKYVGGRGLGGTGRTVIVDFGGGPDTLRTVLDTGFGDTFSQVTGRDYPAWNVGLRFNVPLGGRDRGERDRLQAEVARAAAQFTATHRALDESVRSLHRAVKSQD